MEIVELKCINLLNTLRALQEIECEELGIPVPREGARIKLPDGRDDIHRRLWLQLIDDQWGNQQFSNDSFYRVPFELNEHGEVCEEDLNEDMKKLLDYCRPALNLAEPGFIIGDAFLLFDVWW